MEEQIEKIHKQGIIEPSQSPLCSPIWIVLKKLYASGKATWQIVIYYLKLNEPTVDDKYPIPNIMDIPNKLSRSHYFTTLNLASGFHQIEVDPADLEKTTFSVENRLYQFHRMPFGLKNAPATFRTKRTTKQLLQSISRRHNNLLKFPSGAYRSTKGRFQQIKAIQFKNSTRKMRIPSEGSHLFRAY